MTYLPTEEDLALLKSRSKRLYCRIELLNKNYQIIDTIEGLALSGSNSIDADSDTRRTFNLDIFPQKGFSVSQFYGRVDKQDVTVANRHESAD